MEGKTRLETGNIASVLTGGNEKNVTLLNAMETSTRPMFPSEIRKEVRCLYKMQPLGIS